MTSSFSVYRLWSLMRADFLAERRALIWITVVLSFIVLLWSLKQIEWEYVDYAMHDDLYSSMHQKLYGYALFILGIFATSRSFRAVHDPTRNEAYLLLPASSLEKFFARLLPVTLAIGFFLPIFLFALTAIIESFSMVVSGTRRPIFNPLDSGIWKIYGYYIVIQAPFFLGAIWFRRFNLLITSFVIFLFHLLLVTTILITARITIGATKWQQLRGQNIQQDPYTGTFNHFDFMHFGIAHDSFHQLLAANWSFLATVFWVVIALLPPVLWWIAWLRLKEVQVDHGVQ